MAIISVLVLILFKSSIGLSLDFCQNKTKDNLIDGLFQFKDTIYVIRAENESAKVFILKTTPNGSWFQAEEAIDKDIIFRGSPPTFDSGFAVSDFVKCDSNVDTKCLYESSEFDASNITFLFSKKNFYIYRRIHDSRFDQIWSEPNTIPWKADNKDTQSTTELFHIPKNSSRIDGAVFTLPEGHDSPKRAVIVLSGNMIHTFDFNDAAANARSIPLKSSPTTSAEGKGGFLDKEGQVIFIVGDKLYKVSQGPTGKQYLEDMKMTSWDYFNCQTMEPFVTTTVLPETSSTPLMTADTSLTQTDGIPTEAQTMPINEDKWEKDLSTDPSIDLPDPNTSPKDDKSGEEMSQEDIDFRKNLLTLLWITFGFVVLSILLVSVLSLVCFQIFQ